MADEHLNARWLGVASIGCEDGDRGLGVKRFPWKQNYCGVGIPELQRLKGLERENARLKRMYAEQALQLTAIEDVLSRTL